MTQTPPPPPKLFTRKPKKAQIKQFQGNVDKDFSPPPSAPPATPAPTPAAPVKESFASRYKFLWPLLLTVNLTFGAYILMRTKKKDASGEGESAIPVAVAVAATDLVPTAVPAAENLGSSDVASLRSLPSQVSAVSEHTAVSQVTTAHPFTTMAVPEDRQRELLKWILDEKRKIKPKDSEEKKCIDADKAVLKQYIRAKSIPSI